MAFHRPEPTEEWLLVEGLAPVAADGLMGFTGDCGHPLDDSSPPPAGSCCAVPAAPRRLSPGYS